MPAYTGHSKREKTIGNEAFAVCLSINCNWLALVHISVF